MSYILKDEKEFKKLIKENKTKSWLARHYQVSIPVINKWIKQLDLKVIPYKGRKFFKTNEEKIEATNNIKSLRDKKFNYSEIERKTGIPRAIVTNICKELNLQNTQFDIWDEQRKTIKDNLEYYKNLNKTKTLKEISIEENISIEQLKRVFNENNVETILHSYNKSKGELEVRDFIRSLDVTCESKYFKDEETRFELDCYCEEYNYGIEYCGEYWHSEDKNKHEEKRAFFEKLGIKIFTLFETEWKNSPEICKSMIRNSLQKSQKIYARKCNLEEVSSAVAKEFHNNNHLNGYSASSKNYGLFFEGELVSCLSIVKSRFDKSYEYEISRFSSKLNHTVVGGLSKLFKEFTTQNPDATIMTYSDLRVGNGKAYEKIGFKFLNQTPPNYWYFNKKVGFELENRMKYQKSKISNTSNSHLTEREIMANNGFLRVYDCGNLKWGWNGK